jgi:hypothetical protein
MMSVNLYELLVPRNYEDSGKPIRTAHHRQFDLYVLKIANGITILKPTTIGYWVDKGRTYKDSVIPVRIACTELEIIKIGKFAKCHYRQKSIMIYKLSDQVFFI